MSIEVRINVQGAAHLVHRGLTVASPRALLFISRDGEGLDYGH